MTSNGTVPAETALPISSRPGPLLGLVLLAIAGAYSSAPLGDFVWDDTTLVLEQRIVREMQPISSYFDRMFFGGPAGAPTRTFYRPLVTLSFALDWQLWGGSPLGFHLTNILVHLACAALVFWIARRWGAKPLAAALGAAAFGLLPRLTEAVAWISGRTDLLASFFVLAALALHAPPAAEATVSDTRRWLASLLLLLGLLSKEVAIAGLAAIVALEVADARQKERGARRWWARLSPIGAALAIYAGLRTLAELTANAPSTSPPLDPGTRSLVALEAIGSYVWALVDPLRPRTQIGSIFARAWPIVFLGGLSVTGLFAAGWAGRKHRARVGGRANALTLLALIPIALVIHLLPIPLQVAAADRFLYLPAAALAIGAAMTAGRLQVRRARVLGAIAAALLPALAFATYLRTVDWQDEVSLWSEAVEHAPEGNSYPFVQLGIALSRTDRAEEALPALERAEAIDAELVNRGVSDVHGTGSREAKAFALAALGRFPEALSIFEGLAAARPKNPTYRYNCGVIRAMSLDFKGATEDLRLVLKNYPDHEWAGTELARVERLASAWGRLPPESPDEPAEVTRIRAGVLEDLGRVRDARRLRSQLAEGALAR